MNLNKPVFLASSSDEASSQKKILEDKYGKNDFTDRARKKYPKLIEYISHLPYTHISNVKINFQTAAVKAHIDFQPENQHLALSLIHISEPTRLR